MLRFTGTVTRKHRTRPVLATADITQKRSWRETLDKNKNGFLMFDLKKTDPLVFGFSCLVSPSRHLSRLHDDVPVMFQVLLNVP